MIICIFGASCVGKSTVATRLASHLNWPLRSCGSAVRERARVLHVTITALSEDEHRAIDAETIAWAAQHRDCVIEGRFLNHICPSIPDPVGLIELHAAKAVRRERWEVRDACRVSMDDLQCVDQQDDAHRLRLFSSMQSVVASKTFDTTNCSVEECVQGILKACFP